MRKVFLLEGDAKSEPLDVLTAYIMPALKKAAVVVHLSAKEQKTLKLETLPCLLHDDLVIADPEKLAAEICKIAEVEPLIMKEPEVWPIAKKFLLEGSTMPGNAVLAELRGLLGSRKFLAADHITLADVFAALPGLRALKELSEDKLKEWMSVYRWAVHLLSLPCLDIVLDSRVNGFKIYDGLLNQEEAKGGSEEKKEGDSKKDKKKKAKEKAKEKAKASKQPEVDPFAQLDIRVGKIVKIDKHPESTKLYTEEIDIGGEIRKIASGLQEFVPIEELKDRHVVVFCNLKPKPLAGYMSHGMILCASNDDHSKIEVLIPPEGAKAGDAVTVEGVERSPAAEVNLSKGNNPWKKVEPKLTTSESLTVTLDGKELKAAGGVITTKSLKAAHIS